jgi:HD-GYP domain-containing protein (c-di-GMP phosphodiesterase class II)
MKRVIVQSIRRFAVVTLLVVFPLLSAERALALPPEVEEMVGTNGTWPARQMTEAMVRDWTTRATEAYGLTADQRAKFEARLKNRWLGFVEQHQRELERLLNEYLEARFGDQPPDADRVAEWASRAIPLFERARLNLAKGEAEIREILDSRQRAEFDAQQAQNRAALGTFERKLKRWSVGRFDEREWWEPPAERGMTRDSARATASQPAQTGAVAGADHTRPNAASEMPPRVVEELDAWQQYVQAFCDHFELDQAQRNAAESMLREMRQRARDFVYRHRERVAAVEEMIANAVGVDPQVAEREIEEVYGPIDAMFRELDSRLQRLPTPGQVRRAEALQAQEATTEAADNNRNATTQPAP